jgi:CHASE3 domain sensor protein
MMEMLSPETVKQWLDLGVTFLLAGYLIVRQDRMLQEIRILLQRLLDHLHQRNQSQYDPQEKDHSLDYRDKNSDRRSTEA